MSKQYKVTYTSSATGNRIVSPCATKAATIKEAVQLFREGARNIRTFYWENGMVVDFDWRKTGRYSI